MVFTYQFISDPKVGSTNAGTYDLVKNVEAINDYTVKVTFKTVNPAWSLPFVGSEGMILPAHIYQDFLAEKARQAPLDFAVTFYTYFCYHYCRYSVILFFYRKMRSYMTANLRAPRKLPACILPSRRFPPLT